MKYKVLYRKYRPTDFENIIGQDYIVTTLKNSVIHNNISHAYIFSGPRGTGKTTTAKVFSKAINCLEPKDGAPCGKCEFCQNFQENPDIIEIDAASNNGVEEIRNLIDNIKLAPTNGKYKVYIIDEVHMLTDSAFNALLLTLEEPPSHSIFILATTNIEKVPITILSRCQRFDFQKITVDCITDRLKQICELENIKITSDALEEIAYLSEGGMRDALSLLDQLSKSGEEITIEFVDENIRTVSIKNIKELLDTIENNDSEKCLNLLNEYRNRAVDYKTLVKKLIDVAAKRAKKIKLTSKYTRLSFEDYKKLILNLADSITKININVDSYTILEMILLEFLNPTIKPLENKKEELTIENDQKNADSEFIFSSSNENSEEKIENGLSKNISSKEFNTDLITIRINNCFVDAQKKLLENTKKEINDIINDVNTSGEIKSILLDSVLVAASPKNLIFTTPNDHSANKANKMLNKIENAIRNAKNMEYKVIFITPERWQKEREKYVENIKAHKNYSYIEESEVIHEETKISDVFDPSKVEII